MNWDESDWIEDLPEPVFVYWWLDVVWLVWAAAGLVAVLWGVALVARALGWGL